MEKKNIFKWEKKKNEGGEGENNYLNREKKRKWRMFLLRLGGLSKDYGFGLVEASTISPGLRDKTASWTLSWSTISLLY